MKVRIIPPGCATILLVDPNNRLTDLLSSWFCAKVDNAYIISSFESFRWCSRDVAQGWLVLINLQQTSIPNAVPGKQCNICIQGVTDDAQRWAFPSKQNPAHRNDALVARTRELWEKNTTQKDMVGILQAEGFTVTERELMRLRSKHRLLLREANASRTTPVDDVHPLPESVSAETVPSVWSIR